MRSRPSARSSITGVGAAELMFYPVWWGFLLAAANAGGVVFTGAMIASVPDRNAGY